MTLLRTVAPDVEPVTLGEAKAQMRIAHESEDDLISGLIRAAREEVERATGLVLIEQSWRLVLDRWPRNGLVRLARGPVTEVLSVTVYGSEGEAAVLPPTAYEADLVSRPARLSFLSRPEPLRTMNGIEIDFSAGFGETGADVPELLRRAVLLLVAHWYEFRAAFNGSDQPVSYPQGYERLISGFRRGRL